MSTVDVSAWASTAAPLFTLGDDGQLRWSADVETELSDTETRRSPYGDTIVVRQVWDRDHRVLRRLVVEVDWHAGPMALLEARRPRGGWHADTLARMLLAALTLGAVR